MSRIPGWVWGPFVEYIGDIENLLSYEYPGSLQFNSRFRKRILDSFNESELYPLLIVFHMLLILLFPISELQFPRVFYWLEYWFAADLRSYAATGRE